MVVGWALLTLIAAISLVLHFGPWGAS